MVRRIMAAVALLLAAPAAHAGWRGAEWNMTPQQVTDAMKGEAPLTRAERKGKADENSSGNAGKHVQDGETFEVNYYYDAKGLRSVFLDLAEKKPKARSAKCAAFLQRLIAAHGQPLRESDQIIMRLLIWHDKPNQNRMRLVLSEGGQACGLFYERLGDYEANDLANPGKQVRPPKVTGGGGGSPVDVIIH